MNTKKILLYTGGAVVLGAVAFFVWSFFQKVDIPVGNTTVTLGSDKEDTKDEQEPLVSQSETPFNNPFTQYLDTKFEPITTPDIFADINNFPLTNRL
jgi:hypothetical protein